MSQNHSSQKCTRLKLSSLKKDVSNCPSQFVPDPGHVDDGPHKDFSLPIRPIIRGLGQIPHKFLHVEAFPLLKRFPSCIPSLKLTKDGERHLGIVHHRCLPSEASGEEIVIEEGGGRRDRQICPNPFGSRRFSHPIHQQLSKTNFQ
ncbi:unnamed protein product [Cyprideis torosa]|uniref:Uncharacterized protein n=1 Tax=Cyprideis torosa TaxID=163714 RepID=A0A7R8ZJB4_9CRUS|nr:unnamed protein product [Cyprideis torosa]CAG0888207.1 unnamed protein product [Cyprideis torosa]